MRERVEQVWGDHVRGLAWMKLSVSKHHLFSMILEPHRNKVKDVSFKLHIELCAHIFTWNNIFDMSKACANNGRAVCMASRNNSVLWWIHLWMKQVRSPNALTNNHHCTDWYILNRERQVVGENNEHFRRDGCKGRFKQVSVWWMLRFWSMGLTLEWACCCKRWRNEVENSNTNNADTWLFQTNITYNLLI